MKRLYTSMNIAEIGLLKSLIEEEGIACMIRNEHLSLALGEVPFLDSAPELWVIHDADYPQAQELLKRWQGPQQELAAWRCPQCGEENEGQFAACWKCEYLLEE